MKRLIVEPPLAFEEAAEWATDDELAAARGFAPARGREYLAWRAIVRREIGRDAAIAYNSAGAPVLANYPLHISVSHCRGRVADCREQADGAERNSGHVDEAGQIGEQVRVAVAISDAPCAVDIESVARDFQRAMPRYLSFSEQQLSAHPLFPAIAWCAKETLFKYAGSAMDGFAVQFGNATGGFAVNRGSTNSSFAANRHDAASADCRTLDLLHDLHIDSVRFSAASDTSDLSRFVSFGFTSPLSDGTHTGTFGTLSARIRNQAPVVLHFYEYEGFAIVSLFE